MHKNYLVNPKILSLLGEEESRELSAIDGCLYDKQDRHYLHRLVGRLGDELIKYVTRYSVKKKDIQALISEQDADALVRAGVLVRENKAPTVFDIKLVVDEYGNLIRSEIDNGSGKRVLDGSTANKDLNVQDFIYRLIGQYYRH
ncbi:MAG: hypothetical protein J6A83_09090 [Clostridia bacterium]|nr:hypothetical protein [Clostridia bacterium]